MFPLNLLALASRTWGRGFFLIANLINSNMPKLPDFHCPPLVSLETSIVGDNSYSLLPTFSADALIRDQANKLSSSEHLS